MVTHDPNAASYADRVVFLADGTDRRRAARADRRRACWTPTEALDTDAARRPTDAARDAQEPALPQAPAVPVRPAVVLGVMFVSGSLRADRHAGPLVRQPLRRRSTPTPTCRSRPSRRSPVARSRASRPATPCRPPTWTRSQASPACASATGAVVADGARVIGNDGKVVTSLGPPRSAATGRRGRPAELREGRGAGRRRRDRRQRRAGQGRQRQGRRPGRRAHRAASKKTFKLVGIFGYTGGQDSHRRRARWCCSPRRSRSS